MSEYKGNGGNEIFSRALKAGRRTYFFDVRETKAGDYYLTITESKRVFQEEGSAPSYQKHKLYLYKEDFENFREMLDDATKFIVDEKGEEVISEKHDRDYKVESAAFTIESDEDL